MRCSMGDVPKQLKIIYGLAIGYTGLLYYRKQGLIPEPERVGKEKYYDIDVLYRAIKRGFRHRQDVEYDKKFRV